MSSTAAQPLELLAEPEGLPAFDLPDALARLYPGTLGFPPERLYANFVASLDGAVGLQGVDASNRLIADGSNEDHLVMALLRACADVVLIGAGTLRASAGARWIPESAFPGASDAFAELRESLGLSPQPEIAVVASALERLPLAESPREPIVLRDPGGGLVDLGAAVEELRRRGHRRILCEGGPTLFGSLLEAGLVDELFLTLSPIVAGRGTGREVLALVEAARFLPDRRVRGSLAGVRRSGSHLFLRYVFG